MREVAVIRSPAKLDIYLIVQEEDGEVAVPVSLGPPGARHRSGVVVGNEIVLNAYQEIEPSTGKWIVIPAGRRLKIVEADYAGDRSSPSCDGAQHSVDRVRAKRDAASLGA